MPDGAPLSAARVSKRSRATDRSLTVAALIAVAPQIVRRQGCTAGDGRFVSVQ